MTTDMLNMQNHNMEKKKHEITSVRFFIATTLRHEVRIENWPNTGGFCKEEINHLIGDFSPKRGGRDAHGARIT